MKKYIYLLVIVVFCVSQSQAGNLNNNHENKSPSRVEKQIFKGIRIQEIKIDHDYGNITIKESKSSAVEVEVRYFDNKNKKTTADISIRKNTLYVKTNDSKKNHSQGARIDYILSVPQKSVLEVELSYGNIKIDNLIGNSVIKLQYGNLTANNMGNVTIRGHYNEISLNNVKDLALNCDYSKVKVNKANNMELKSKYTDFNINLAESIVKGSFSDHGDLKINQVKDVDVNLKYSDISINKLSEKLKSECDYSDVNINLVDKTLKSVDIKSSFSDINIGFNNTLSTEIDLKTTQGEIKIAKKIDQNYKYVKKESNKEVRRGTLGQGKPTASITVSTTFADINIK